MAKEKRMLLLKSRPDWLYRMLMLVWQEPAFSRQHLVSVRVYVTDINQWPTFNRIYGEWIGDSRPARAVAGVAELHYGFAVEIEAIALAQKV